MFGSRKQHCNSGRSQSVNPVPCSHRLACFAARERGLVAFNFRRRQIGQCAYLRCGRAVEARELL